MAGQSCVLQPLSTLCLEEFLDQGNHLLSSHEWAQLVLSASGKVGS